MWSESQQALKEGWGKTNSFPRDSSTRLPLEGFPSSRSPGGLSAPQEWGGGHIPTASPGCSGAGPVSMEIVTAATGTCRAPGAGEDAQGAGKGNIGDPPASFLLPRPLPCAGRGKGIVQLR